MRTAARQTLALSLLCLCLVGCAAPAPVTVPANRLGKTLAHAPTLEQSYRLDPGYSFDYPAGWEAHYDEAHTQSVGSMVVTLLSEPGLDPYTPFDYEPGQRNITLLEMSNDLISEPSPDSMEAERTWAASMRSGFELKELEAARLVKFNGNEYALATYQLTAEIGTFVVVTAVRVTDQSYFGAYGFGAVEDQAALEELMRAVLATLEFNP